MGTIALTVKKNNCESNYSKKLLSENHYKIYRGNAQQVAFTPIKFVRLPIVQISYQVTPFLNNVSIFQYFCSFKVGCFTAIKKASRFFLLPLFIGADIRTVLWKTWSVCWKRCFAGSESLFGFPWPLQRVITFRLVSPMSFSLQEQNPS